MNLNDYLKSHGLSRRNFLQSGAVGALATTMSVNVVNCGKPPEPKPEFQALLSEKVRWGVIGLGSRGSKHVEFIQEFPDFKITAICDINEQKLKPALDIIPGPPNTYTDYHKLIEDNNVDAVLIAVPNYLHKQLTVDALQGGKHVLCEKPMATSVADGEAMISAWKESGKILMIGTQLRYSNFYEKVKELVETKAIGELRFMWQNLFRGDWKKQSNDPEEDRRINWRYYREKSGGTLIEISIHYMDLLMWFAGKKPTRLTGGGGLLNYSGRNTIDCASLVVDFGDDLVMTHGLSMFSPGLNNTVLIGSDGMLDIYPGHFVIELRRGAERETIKPPVQGTYLGNYEMYEEFIHCIKEDRQARHSPEDILISTKVCLLGEEAILAKSSLNLEGEFA